MHLSKFLRNLGFQLRLELSFEFLAFFVRFQKRFLVFRKLVGRCCLDRLYGLLPFPIELTIFLFGQLLSFAIVLDQVFEINNFASSGSKEQLL